MNKDITTPQVQVAKQKNYCTTTASESLAAIDLMKKYFPSYESWTNCKTKCDSCKKNEQHFIDSGAGFNTSCLSEYNGQTLCPNCIPAN